MTKIHGLQTLSYSPHVDERGSWQRLFETSSIPEISRGDGFVQASISRNPKVGTLRGMHSLAESYGEIKVVSCLSGKVQDVVLDARPDSPTFGEHESFQLSWDVPRAIVIPPGCAHGFLTLEENSSLLYLMSKPYDVSKEICFRWDDPFWGVEWDIEPRIISEKDKNHKLYE